MAAGTLMVKIGLWLELGIGFLVGLGVGSLIGQRTVSTVLMIVLEIIVTPILAAHVIPYFINGQRVVVGIAMDQLRPAGLAGTGAGGPGRVLFGGRGVLEIPPMPTWAMITVIVGWIVGLSAAPLGLAAPLMRAVQYTTRSTVALGQSAACSATRASASDRMSSHRQPATPRPHSFRPA